MLGEVRVGDHGALRTHPVGHRLGLPDLVGEQLRVHGAAVDVPERDPPARQEPVKLDDPPDEVRVRLLPERFSTLAEKLVDEGSHPVGQRVGVEERIVERVPLPRSAEPDFEVVVSPTRVPEDAPDLMAEVSFDFEHERARAAVGIVGPPVKQLAGERVHAGRGLAGADGPDDEHAGVESLLGNDEPRRPLARAGGGGMVQLPDDERWLVVLGRRGPLGQPAPADDPHERLKPDPPDREAEVSGEDDGRGRCRVVPDADRGVDARIVVGDQVEVGVLAQAGERRADGAPGRRADGRRDDDERAEFHREVNLPVGIDGAVATPRDRGQGCANTPAPEPVPSPRRWGSLPPRTVPPARHRPTSPRRRKTLRGRALPSQPPRASPDGPSAHRTPASIARSCTVVGRPPLTGSALPEGERSAKRWRGGSWRPDAPAALPSPAPRSSAWRLAALRTRRALRRNPR